MKKEQFENGIKSGKAFYRFKLNLQLIYFPYTYYFILLPFTTRQIFTLYMKFRNSYSKVKADKYDFR